MNFINKFQKFMYGRYGIDELYGFLLKLYIILVIIGLFIRSKLLLLLEILIIFVMSSFIFIFVSLSVFVAYTPTVNGIPNSSYIS